MKLLRSFPLLCFVLVLLAIGALCMAQRSVQLLLVAGTLSAMSWFITEGPRGRTLPRWVSNVLVVGVAVNFFVDFIQHRDEPLAVLGRFAVFLVLIKLYERKTPRDHAQLLSLSLLLMITACLQATELLFGVVLVIYCVLGLYVLLLYQLYTAFEVNRIARQESIPTGYRLAPALRPVFGRLPGLHFRSQAAGIGAAGAALSLLIFVTFPRDIGWDVLGKVQSISGRRTTQFTSQIDLITGTRISSNRTHIMSVQVLDADGHPMRAESPLLLRGAIVDVYDGNGRWSFGSSSPRLLNLDAGVFQPLREDLGDIDITKLSSVRVNLSRSDDVIFSPYAPIAVRTDVQTDVEYEPVRQTLRIPGGSRRVMGYSVRFDPQPSVQDARRLIDNRRIGLAPDNWFKDSDGRVRELAMRLLEDAGINPGQLRRPSLNWELNHRCAEVFAAHLRSGEFTYTLDLRGIRAGVDDPIANFLLESKRGHCEYFASALAALCHSVGIPARIALGYVAYDFDELSRQYEVLASNAHAWVEVLTGDARWTVIDPTPPAILDPPATQDQATFAEQFRRMFQQFEGNWSSSVMEFDSAAQRRLADSLNLNWSQRLGGAVTAVREWMARVNDAFYFGPAGYIWMGIVGTALGIAIIALVKLMRRSRAIHQLAGLSHMHGSEYQRMLRQLGFYLDMLAVLKRGGVQKPPWQPPRHFADELEGEWPAAAELVTRITDVFYQVRYGGRRLDSRRMNHARALVRQLAKTLRVRE